MGGVEARALGEALAGVDVYLLLPVEYIHLCSCCSIAIVRLGRPARIRMLYRLPCSSPIVLGGVRRTTNDPGRARRRSHARNRAS